MQDRPTIDELLEAVARYLREDAMANTQGRTNFHARVAMHVVEMLRREISTIEEHYAREWDGLDHLLGVQPMPPHMNAMREALVDRNRALSEKIRAGEADASEWRLAVMSHLNRVIHDKLTVSNPGLAAET